MYLTGKPRRGVGPHDVALALIKATFADGFVNNRVLEFAGPGIAGLPMDYRSGIDVMTTETTCLSSIWQTDGTTRDYLALHGRKAEYQPLQPGLWAYYDRSVTIALDEIEPMIALPFHPSNAYTIREFLDNAQDILAAVEADARARFPKANIHLLDKCHDGGVWADQGVIAGCAGGLFDNITEAADILRGESCGSGYFSLDVYPTSVPVSLELTRTGVTADLLETGAIIKPSFCGPCFGAGDVPANNGLSLRHTTRNFPNREGSKPAEGQFAGVCLMDARSIAATARNGGKITPATEVDYAPQPLPYHFDQGVYARRVYNGFGHPQPDTELILGPNITDWPSMPPLGEHLLVELAAVLRDEVTTTDELIPSGETSSYRSNPVTTTDELIPSGETSSYRSNPIKLSQFALSRKDPQYVPRAKAVQELELLRRKNRSAAAVVEALGGRDGRTTGLGTFVMALKPGDGSAREQAASCQRVLGGCANLAAEYATKRYRSNVVNWGMLPFIAEDVKDWNLQPGDRIYLPGIRPVWAPSSWRSNPATAPPASRPPPASVCWAAAPIWPLSTPPSATAPTWSTGACCPLSPKT